MHKSGTASAPSQSPGVSHALAKSLAPALIDACKGRLSNIEWFRSDWQAGGAATGFATYTRDDGTHTDVMVKLPVGPAEHRWTTSLGCFDDPDCDDAHACPTPRVFAHGMELGGYDLAWLVIERLAGPPISKDLTKRNILDMLDAAVDWYERAMAVSPLNGVIQRPPEPDWDNTLSRAREGLKSASVADAQRWNVAIKHTQRLLPILAPRWAARPITLWCHGDLHPGNALHRIPPASNAAGTGESPHEGRCVLIDLALVRVGNWVEDALYLERLYWGRKDQLHGAKPVNRLAKLLKDRGLRSTDEYAELANTRRVLMAASVPAYLAHEGSPPYVASALETLERLLPTVSA